MRLFLTLVLAVSTGTLSYAGGDRTPKIHLLPIGTYETGTFDEGAAEIVAHDPGTQRLFVINADAGTVDVLDISDPSDPQKVDEIDVVISEVDGGPNSVDVKNGIVAVAVGADYKQSPGTVQFYDAASDAFDEPINTVPVGALPDMVTFTPNGSKVLVANEGEPDDDYLVDPEGSISIIDLANGVENATVTTAGFESFNDRKDELIAAGVRIFGPGASVAQDLEPEYITAVTNRFAWVTLQENNAIALVDCLRARVLRIQPLGLKDHMLKKNKLDASNEDGTINIQNWPVLGMFQPDAITSYWVKWRPYLVTANEGDARDYDGFSEEDRVGDLALDPDVFPNATELQLDENLGRLKTTTINENDEGFFEEIYAYGTRSFSIWTASGQLVYDSGDEFERITAALLPDDFNSTNDENGSFDDRSDDKGPEPEGVVVGRVMGRFYAFIGLERVGGIMVYDVTDPYHPFFVTYVNNRDFSGDAAAGTAGDLAPEGLEFIPARQSPIGKPLLAVGNEVSGTTTIYLIDVSRKSYKSK
jgi:hypothetical protein